jgi:hypothetical protein
VFACFATSTSTTAFYIALRRHQSQNHLPFPFAQTSQNICSSPFDQILPQQPFPKTQKWLLDLSSSLGMVALEQLGVMQETNHCSGTGYIGSFTALALLEADYKVVIVDNLYNSSKEVVNRIELISGKRPAFYELDITDEAVLDKVFDEHPDIDNVIHFAALKVWCFCHVLKA